MERIREEFITKPNQPLLIRKTKRGAAIVFTCQGAFSLVNHDHLHEVEDAIGKVEENRIVLDLREVTFLDSSGLGTLAATLKKAQERGKELVLVPSAAARSTLATAGLEKVFLLFDTVDDALGAPSR